MLAVFAANFYLQNPVSAVLLAAGITFGAAATVWRLQFHLRSVGAWLAAVGGIIMLLVGMVLAVAHHSGVTRLHTAMMNAWTIAVPVAATVILIGGFLQLPRILTPWIALITGGLIVATWATIDFRFDPVVIWVGALAALCGSAQCLAQLSRWLPHRGRHQNGQQRHQHGSCLACYAAQAALILVIVVAISEIMVSINVGEFKPALLLWELTTITLLGTIAAWTTPITAATAAAETNKIIAVEDLPVTRRYPSVLRSRRRWFLTGSTVQ
ncbi:hypothetical protein [Corynebacterium matruchotii]|uniref:hypothetical protein n=1 Tax=Corynebacterium matruchotii TaxID=43768 RepID=UPI0028D39FA4|nr:hypothetical protein [Corynebacterium matruchotii]